MVVLDEIQRTPERFQALRGVIDDGRRRGPGNGRFLTSGSASAAFLGQSSEGLAGRISYPELSPLDILKCGLSNQDRLWVRAGFPASLLSQTDADSFLWREEIIRTYPGGEVPQPGPRIPPAALRRFWTILARWQGQFFNASRIAGALSAHGRTVGRYLDLLADLMLLLRLKAHAANAG